MLDFLLAVVNKRTKHEKNKAMIMSATLQEDGSLTNVREVDQAIFDRCPFTIFLPEHYDTTDGTPCLCYNSEYRKMMVKAWGYTKKAFKEAGIL